MEGRLQEIIERHPEWHLHLDKTRAEPKNPLKVFLMNPHYRIGEILEGYFENLKSIPAKITVTVFPNDINYVVILSTD